MTQNGEPPPHQINITIEREDNSDIVFEVNFIKEGVDYSPPWEIYSGNDCKDCPERRSTRFTWTEFFQKPTDLTVEDLQDVVGNGISTATVMVIEQAPSDDEDTEGIWWPECSSVVLLEEELDLIICRPSDSDVDETANPLTL